MNGSWLEFPVGMVIIVACPYTFWLLVQWGYAKLPRFRDRKSVV